MVRHVSSALQGRVCFPKLSTAFSHIRLYFLRDEATRLSVWQLNSRQASLLLVAHRFYDVLHCFYTHNYRCASIVLTVCPVSIQGTTLNANKRPKVFGKGCTEWPRAQGTRRNCTGRRLFKPHKRQTDTANIGKNSQHLMHSMQPKDWIRNGN